MDALKKNPASIKEKKNKSPWKNLGQIKKTGHNQKVKKSGHSEYIPGQFILEERIVENGFSDINKKWVQFEKGKITRKKNRSAAKRSGHSA